MPNFRLLIEYDGTAYCGWQRQAADPTVQAAVEDALATLLREKVTIAGAGRTDAGVHARGQVASFATASAMEPSRIAAGLNGLLPEDIAVLACDSVPESFHARFDARGRRYSYTISTGPAALDRRRVWEVGWALDLAVMTEAAASIAGTHDFTSFSRSGSGVRHHRCDVRAAGWTRTGRHLRFDIAADRFLHGMVRALVGSMVDVGRGHTPLAVFLGMLACLDRKEAGPSAPPAGLILEEVLY
jgi:tRNA pseudouridine38-40 synthase